MLGGGKPPGTKTSSVFLRVQAARSATFQSNWRFRHTWIMDFTLPAKYFCCPHVFAQETERLFTPSWMAVGRSEDVATRGRFVTVTVEGHDLVLVRGDDGLRCFHNTCRHRGTRLLEAPRGELTGRCIVCPYHAWKYDTEGQLVAAPNMPSDGSFDTATYGLQPVPVTEWLGFAMVCLDGHTDTLPDDHQQLEAQLAPWQLPTLRRAAALDYRVAANWKLVMQNYSECYHCPTVHPALHRLTSFRSSTNDLTSGPFLGGPMQLNDGCETMSVDGKRVGTLLPALSDTQRREVYYYVLFPNLLVSLHPDFVMTHTLKRESIDVTQVRCEFHFHPDALAHDRFTPDRAVEFWDEVNRQDWHVCELSQQGAHNPAYRPGPYSPYESMLIAFDQHYLETMAITG